MSLRLEKLEKGLIFNNEAKCNSEYSIYLLQNQREILEFANSAEKNWTPYKMDIYHKHISPKIIDTKENWQENLKLFLQDYNIEDIGWNWNTKAFSKFSNNYIWSSLVVNDINEGIIIGYHPENSKIYEYNIIYIDYLATAPWNRKTVLGVGKYIGIGTLLLKATIKYGLGQFNYTPGFNLHSLSHAEDYYRKIGMRDLGIDNQKEGLRIFEMEKEGCELFLYDNKI
ncbi:GNAT family N-acetyltransferase [Leptospira santarosai]|nr:GNAT family N-acetyltransferase [Leptospira santarosai]EKS09245.1 hypothetical protein LEP1GSC071_2773 [Leptospira santarosai str. JET]MBW9231482.1 GNAT family N-acetyltransferase [Leptospira santarosai]OLY61850.1 GNAT family N-acetyltransferase [Leptospira santarosai serovar Guaricura]